MSLSSRFLSRSIQKQGYSLVPISVGTAQQLNSSLELFAKDKIFRFPPPEGCPYDTWLDTYKEVSEWCYVSNSSS